MARPGASGRSVARSPAVEARPCVAHRPRIGPARRTCTPAAASKKPAPPRPLPPRRRPQVLPDAPRELVEELSRRYVHLYERITGEAFIPPPAGEPTGERIARALKGLA